MKVQNPLIRNNISYLRKGFLMNNIFTLFKSEFDIDVHGETLHIITFSIIWVQRHENRQRPCIFMVTFERVMYVFS